ncbi:glucosamine-6-phosphate deaminase [Fulvivirga sp. M361]|uniref:glucosamine-6-phosphate deaminase n=1 Tax=Fulvivirga sp. M361 TaxID=2594266 RepID=UPI00117B3837|nr:glucosamine-6-phosphate deaminase [Fulvivirga sp. M361]
MTTETQVKHAQKQKRPLPRYERIHTEVVTTSIEAVKLVADEITELIKERQQAGENCVLGLATGSTPVGLYNELVRRHDEEGLSFSNVITFNLDEYFPMDPEELQSYVRFMNEHLFYLVDIKKENIHIPNGTLPRDLVATYCKEYEQKIEAAGGLDLQILGIGRTGHIGFNEPGSGMESGTRLVTLDHVTRKDAASDFYGEENVPRRAITMGVGTIMSARRIILMAWGEGKASIIKEAVEGEPSDSVPATFLQNHVNASIVTDEAAAAELVRIKTPWLVTECKWDHSLAKKAVIWLSQKIDKPILKLTDRDYADHGMSDLITTYGPAYDINIKIFNDLQKTITGWPGGKPDANDTNRPERAEPAQKRVVLFSPHPDDDVISMGGTFGRLVKQGHEVHVAYQTSGNIAVFDDDVIRYADFFRDLNHEYDFSTGKGNSLYAEITKSIYGKKAGDVDSLEVMKIKALIRRSEAKAGCRYLGVPDSQAHFLDLPFYETGLVKKKPIGKEDVNIVTDLLRKIQPHQIYAAGDLSDPHGTHRVCLDVIFEALEQIRGEDWARDCWVWLYRGAWQEWDINDIDMAIPLSPDELIIKRKAIFKHQSQKDTAVFPGNDSREFWQRSEQRNRHTAKVFDQLGLSEYEAIEAFKRHFF